MTEPTSRFSLRDLPIPAKLVITCFLLAVGGGYSAAMVQLHMQDSKSGQPMPTVDDVILKYTGKKWFQNEADVPKPMSQFVKLLTTDENAPFNGSGTMFPAFTTKDGAFGRSARAGGAELEKLKPQRIGERDTLVLWANSPPDVRRKAFDNDHFTIDDTSKRPKEITPKFVNGDAIKVKSIIEERCVVCHKPGGDPNAANYPLQTYEQIEKYLAVPESGLVGPNGGWVRVCEPIGLEKLTQTTHAHLLSFAVLFALTGLAFAFTSYPAVFRCILGPLVLLAVVADVSLWWLARLSNEWGPYFAMGIIGTGGAAGVGLAFQITLSLFNMYGAKGKFAILLLFALGGGIAGLVFLNQIEPGLKAKQERLNAKAEPDKKDPPKNGGNGGVVNVPPTKWSPAQRMLQFPVKGPDGKDIPWADLKFKKEQDGGMVRAFFDKDSDEFAAALKDKDVATQQRLTPLRHGERDAILAWSKLLDPERRTAFEADTFVLPPTLVGKPLTPDYLKDGKVKMKSLITDRCIRCHADEEKAPFDSYESMLKYLK